VASNPSWGRHRRTTLLRACGGGRLPLRPTAARPASSTKLCCCALHPEMGHKGPQGHRSAAALPTDLLSVVPPALQAQAGAASGRQSEAIAIGNLSMPSLLPQGPQGGGPRGGGPQAGRCGAQAGNGKLGRLRRVGERPLKPTGRLLRIASIDQQQISPRRSQGPGGEATEFHDRRCHGPRFERPKRRPEGPGCHWHRRERQWQGHGEDSGCFFSATAVTRGY
jgi:hypothetical protein